MSDFSEWLFGLVTSIFTALWDFLGDIFIFVIELLLKAFVYLFATLPSACFMTVGGGGSALGNALSAVPSYIWYFAGNLNLGGCFGIFACAASFILARKIATLFQW